MEENRVNTKDGNALDRPHAAGYATSNRSHDDEGITIKTIGNEIATPNQASEMGKSFKFHGDGNTEELLSERNPVMLEESEADNGVFDN